MTLKTYKAPQYGFDVMGVWAKATRDMQQEMDKLQEQVEHVVGQVVREGLGWVGHDEVAPGALSLAHARVWPGWWWVRIAAPHTLDSVAESPQVT